MNAIKLAILFHDLYEKYAPEYGYQTKEETKVFNASSSNGKLMIRTCREISKLIEKDHLAALAEKDAIIEQKKEVIAGFMAILIKNDEEIDKEKELTDKAWREYTKRDKELQTALAEQRRRMGTEYDELKAELKRVREVAVMEIERLKGDIKAMCDFVPEGWPMPLGWRELAWRAKEANEMEKEIERLKNMIGASEWIQTEELKSLGETIDEHEREIEQLKDHEKLFNPCNHTPAGFESISCQICGYPDSRKLIAALRAELKQQFEESIAVIHDQGAENLILKQNLALNAKMLDRQNDLAREAETEAKKLRNALEVVQANYDIYTTALVKFVVDEALK